QPGERLDHGDGGAEAGEDLGELGTDRPAAQDHERLRHLLGLNDVPVCPVRSAGQALDWRDGRIGPAPHDDALAGAEDPVALAGADGHLPGPGDLGGTADQMPALAGETV